MEAYVAAIIEEYNGVKDKHLRILDLTPNVQNNIVICSEDKFREILINGIAVPGFSLDADNNILYYGFDYELFFPHIKTKSSTVQKFSILRIIKGNSGEFEALTLRSNGTVNRELLRELFNKRDKITNMEFRTIYGDGGELPHLDVNNSTYIPLSPDGRLFPTSGINCGNITREKYNFLDKNHPMRNSWISQAEFILYSELTGMNYSIDDVFGDGTHKFSGIDLEPEVVTIPRGVYLVESISNQKENHSIKTVRIPNTVGRFYSSAFKNLKSLEGLEFEPGDPSRRFETSFITYLDREIYDWKKFIPDLERLDLIGSSDLDTSADLGEFINTKRIYSCFRTQATIHDKLVLPPNLSRIDDSYIGIALNQQVIKIHSNVESIRHSFLNINCDNLVFDFSEASKLYELYSGSFSGLNITKLDMSGCTRLEFIYDDCFSNLPNLEEVILPPNLRSIGRNSFIDCPKLTHIEFPESMQRVESGVFNGCSIENIRLSKNIRLFNTAAIPNIYVEKRDALNAILPASKDIKVVIEEGVTSLGSNVIAHIIADNVTFPKTITKLEYCAFSYGAGNLNLYDWNITYIPYSCFEASSYKCLILPKSTKKIDEKAFADATRLEKVFIPSSVTEIGNKAFLNTGKNLPVGTIFYVVEGSFAEKALAKAKQNCVKCSSNEEALDKILGRDTEASLSMVAKARMIYSMSGDEIQQSMTKEPYIKNIGVLNEIYTISERPEFLKENEVKLDFTNLRSWFNAKEADDKIRELNINKRRDSLSHLSPLPRDVLEDLSSFDEMNNKLDNKFKVLCNSITRFTKPVYQLSKIDKLLKLYEMLPVENTYIKYYNLFSDRYASIDAVYFRSGPVDKKILDGTVLYITIGKTVVYGTAHSLLDADKFATTDPYKSSLLPYYEMEDLFGFNIDAIFKPNDIIPFAGAKAYGKAKIRGVEVPAPLWKKLNDALYSQLVLIGAFRTGSKHIYLLNTFTGKIYVGKSNIKIEREINNITDCGALLLTGIYDMNSLGSKEIQEIQSLIDYKGEFIDQIEKLVDEEKYLAQLINSKDAFDPLTSAYEWDLAKAISSGEIGSKRDGNPVKSLDELDSKRAELIFDTSFFNKVNKTFEDLENNHSHRYTINLADSGTIEVYSNCGKRSSSFSFIGYSTDWYSFIRKPGAAESDISVVYASHYKPADVFGRLKRFYHPEAASYGYLKDELIDTKHMAIIYEANVWIGDCNVGLCINLKDGNTYLYARNRSGLLPILRFKDMQQATKFGYLIYKDAISYTRTKRMDNGSIKSCVDILTYLGSENLTKTNKIARVRKAVMLGYPNGYKLSDADLTQIYFDNCAKQMKL